MTGLPDTNTPDTQYDMSFSTLHRLNYLLWETNKAQKDQNVSEWFEACKIIYKEIYPYIKKKGDLKIKHEKLLNESLTSYRRYLEYSSNYNNAPRKGAFQPPKDIFDKLFLWEMELRADMDAVGLLMKKSESSYGAILG